MSVDIEPVELSFRRPFTSEVTQILKIKNPNSSPVVFKVKTTAPKQYCVRPNAGRIEPGQDFDVSVLLQAMKADPPLDAKCRDKFLVQSARITPDKEFASIATVLETTDKASVSERKIRVNWLAANDSAEPVAHATPSKTSAVNGANHSPEASRTYASPPGTADPASNRPPPPYYESKDDDDSKSETLRSNMSRPSTALSNPVNSQNDELLIKVAQLENELASFKDGGLRQRHTKNVAEADGRPASMAVVDREKQTIEGVTVQMAAILCFLSFMIGYLFF